MSEPTRENDPETSRRKFLRQAAGAAGVAVGGALMASTASGQDGGKSGSADIRGAGDGTYEKVPLRSDSVTVGIVQTPVLPVHPRTASADLRRNLGALTEAIDKTQYYGGHKDLLVFHEFALTGWAKWTRSELLNIAIEIPGPEVEVLGKKAKEHNCYISFGTYAQDKDWPRHIISMAVLIDPKGEVVSKQWKHRNVHGMFQGFELFTTTAYDVLDRYVEMYGRDAVIPVARTDIGNLCFSPCVYEPELYRAMALKGAEFLVRTHTGGGSDHWTSDMPIMCAVNRVYGAYASNAASPANQYFLEGLTAGNTSKIYDPHGKIIAQTEGDTIDCATARIPMAEFRKQHRIPDVHWPLYENVPHPVRFAPGAFLDYLPETLEESGQYFKTKARW